MRRLRSDNSSAISPESPPKISEPRLFSTLKTALAKADLLDECFLISFAVRHIGDPHTNPWADPFRFLAWIFGLIWLAEEPSTGSYPHLQATASGKWALVHARMCRPRWICALSYQGTMDNTD